RAYRRSDVLPPWAANAPEWLAPVTHLRDANLSTVLSVLAELTPEDPRRSAFGPWAAQLNIRSARSFNGNHLITVTAAGVDKGAGLRALCDAMGVDLRDTVAIGDDDVDLPMFEVAGLSIAMGNADEAIRAAADIVTETADAHGVAVALLGL
ncbi:MAG: HAD-IIB family hydrolase, partial [Tepidiformaceae bacterium]